MEFDCFMLETTLSVGIVLDDWKARNIRAVRCLHVIIQHLVLLHTSAFFFVVFLLIGSPTSTLPSIQMKV